MDFDTLTADNIAIHIREDGYVNATKLARAGGREWFEYYRSDRCQNLLTLLLEENNDIPQSDEVRKEHLVHTKTVGPNELRGTWVHPHVAADCADWVSASFAVKVCPLVWGWSTGQVTGTQAAAQAAAQVSPLGSDTPKVIARHERLLRAHGHERGAYAALIGDGLGKIGKVEKNFTSRMPRHQSFFPTFYIFSLVPCSNPYLLERRVLDDPAVRPYRTKYRGQVEMVKFSPDGLTPSKLSEIMEEHARVIESGTQLELARESTKQELARANQEQSRENQELARMKQAEERTKHLALKIELARLRASASSSTASPY
jgi:hypothetical protein